MTNPVNNQNSNNMKYAWLVLGLCASFLFYKYILQVFPSLITNDLMAEYHLTGEKLGDLAATFYYTYMLTQLFVGCLLDKCSVRWFTAAAIFCCALGLGVFSQTYSLLMAEISRGLMGVGVAFATVAYMKLAALWFPSKNYAFVSGLLATAAMSGAVLGQAPLAYLFHSFGWRECLYAISLSGLALSFVFALIVRDKPKKRDNDKHYPSFSLNNLLYVVKNKQNWLLTLYSGLAFCPVAVFGGLWGNPFLQQAYHVNSTQAASMISLIFLGLGIGSPVLGLFSDHFYNRKIVMMTSTFLSFFALVLVLYFNHMPIWVASLMLFTFGFGLGAFMLVFAIGKEINPPMMTATVVAMINASDALLDSVTEPGIGKLLDVFWDGKIVNHAHYFSLHSYHFALAMLPMYLLIASLLLFWVKDNSRKKFE